MIFKQKIIQNLVKFSRQDIYTSIVQMNAISPEMVGFYHVIVKKKKPFVSQSSHRWSLTLWLTGFNFGFFFTDIDNMKALLTPWFFNSILIILLANSVSLALLSMSFVPTCRKTTSGLLSTRVGII